MEDKSYDWDYSYVMPSFSGEFTLEDFEHLIKGTVIGFVYKISNRQTKKFYIGKKLFRFKKRIKRKGKRDKIAYVESDWKDYWGSSKELQADLDKYGKHMYDRKILKFCFSKHELAYEELKEQLRLDIMNPATNTYNGIINVRLRRRI